MIFSGIIVGVIGVFIFLFPESFLRFKDLYRIKGDREYTKSAIYLTKISGAILIVTGLIIIVYELVSI